MTAPASKLHSDILEFLGRTDGKVCEVVERAFRRVYDGLLVSRAVWGRSLDDFTAIAEKCRARNLALVSFYRSDETPPPGDELTLLLPEQTDVNELIRRLDELGLRLHRLARVVASDQDPDAYRIGLLDRRIGPLDRETLRLAPAAFLAVSPGTSPEANTPIMGDKGIEWKPELAGKPEYLLLPIVEASKPVPGAGAVALLLDQLTLERRINITPKAGQPVWDRVLDSFVTMQGRAKDNVQNGIELLGKLSSGFRGCDGKLFDDKSGAVFFEPHVWRRLEQEHAGAAEAKQKLLGYFLEKLSDAWSPTHPCYRRILWTPTKVLLRGEEYYVNMRRLSPFKRFELILAEMRIIRGLVHGLHDSLPALASDESEWKLTLALLDQMRNISLQTFSFLHEAAQVFEDNTVLKGKLSRLWGDGKDKAHGFLRCAVRAYYGWLLGRVEEATGAMDAAARCFSGIEDDLGQVAKDLRDHVNQRRESQSEKLKDLVRGWREADHPGENLLTAVIAAEKHAGLASLTAVGIGWGGIELPLVLDYIAEVRCPAQTRQIFIAKWSHYRDKERPPTWSSFPKPGRDMTHVKGCEIALLDDNTLSGITLEKIRDELLLAGASRVHMFVTRYSGERRLCHMQMEEEGVIDPKVMMEVGGYLGETAFARSWSKKKKDYKNQIGVFSLARRRILECIYNNSTVELYDREGF